MREIDRLLQWCPHRRTPISFDPGPGPNLAVAGNAMTSAVGQIQIGTCIGSACSQWRWETDPFERVWPPTGFASAWVRGTSGELDRAEPVRPAGLDPSFSWNPRINGWQRAWPVGQRHGHCGLAGDAPFD